MTGVKHKRSSVILGVAKGKIQSVIVSEPSEQDPEKKRGNASGLAAGCGVLLLAAFLWFYVLAFGIGQADSSKPVPGWLEPSLLLIPVVGIVGAIAIDAFLRHKK